MATIEYLAGGIAKFVKNGRTYYHGPKSNWCDESLQAVEHHENQERLKIENGKEREFEESHTIEEWRELAKVQIAEKTMQEFEARMNDAARIFMAHHPGYVACPENFKNISHAITALLENSGRAWPNFTTFDLHSAIDQVYDDGRLIFNGKYERLTPTESELRAMPLDQLLNLEIESRNS